MEIERKFEIRYLPGDLSEYPCKNIMQGYLCRKPVLRIRKSNEEYILTYKLKVDPLRSGEGSPLVNEEVELPLTKEAFDTLLKKIEGNIISKMRYLIPLEDGLTAELDVFGGCLTGLIFAEVEFPDEKTAEEFNPPDWFGQDLSADKRYSNYHLAQLADCQELLL